MPVTQEEKTGVIELFYDAETGSIKEDGNNTPREFYQHGAQVDFKVGDSVIYINIYLPNGRIITKDIRKGN